MVVGFLQRSTDKRRVEEGVIKWGNRSFALALYDQKRKKLLKKTKLSLKECLCSFHFPLPSHKTLSHVDTFTQPEGHAGQWSTGKRQKEKKTASSHLVGSVAFMVVSKKTATDCSRMDCGTACACP